LHRLDGAGALGHHRHVVGHFTAGIQERIQSPNDHLVEGNALARGAKRRLPMQGWRDANVEHAAEGSLRLLTHQAAGL
jgi:hypothetical protein